MILQPLQVLYICHINKEKLQNILMLLFAILQCYFSFGHDLTNTQQINSRKRGKNLLTTQNQKKKVLKKTADSLVTLSDIYIKKEEFSEALTAIQKGLKIYKSLDEFRLTGNCNNKMASIYYYQGDFAKALINYDESIIQYKIVDFKKGIASSINNKGAIYYYLGNYPKALVHYKESVKLSNALNDTIQSAATIKNIGSIYLVLKDYSSAMKNFQMAKKTYEGISNNKVVSQILNGIGEIYLQQEDYVNAFSNFNQALRLAEKINAKQRKLETYFNLGELYDNQEKYVKSLSYYNKALMLSKDLKNALYNSVSLTAIGITNYKLGKKQLAIFQCKKGLETANSIKSVSAQKDACKCLYDVYKSLNRKASALAYYEQSINLKDSLQARQTANDLQQMDFENQMLKDSIVQVEKESRLRIIHEREVAEKEKQRNSLIVSGCFVLVLAGGLWSRLNFTKKSKARLQVEKDRSEHLLLNILPEEIAEELKEKGYVDAQDFERASILFTDFKSFTETASKLSPQQLVEEINICFKAFDAIMEIYNIEKIKTIGDAYMAAGGLPKPDAKAVKKTILAALDMQKFIVKRRQENIALNKPAFEMRVGIHVGPIVAGIVGVKKFQYDIWGDTVNTASRMESSGDVGKVNISHATYELVKNEIDLVFNYRGEIMTKGKGVLNMYFVRLAP